MYQSSGLFKSLVSVVILRALCVPLIFVTQSSQSQHKEHKEQHWLVYPDSQLIK